MVRRKDSDIADQGARKMGIIFYGTEYQFKNLLAMKFPARMLYYYCCVVNFIAMKGLNAKFFPKKSIKGVLFCRNSKDSDNAEPGARKMGVIFLKP